MRTKSIAFNLALAALLLGAAAGSTYAARLGLIGGELPTRGTMALAGLILAFYANFIPKFLAPNFAQRPARVQRLAGWAFVLSGFASAAIWAFAPLDSAALASMAAVGTALGAVIGYCALTHSKPA